MTYVYLIIDLVPTRNTSYSHLRDGFVRALQSRILLAKKDGQLNADEELAVQSPLRQFKTLFPNTPLAKHTPLDILLTAPEKGSRMLILRDLGAVQDKWMTTEFVLAYFEGNGISPPVSLLLYQCAIVLRMFKLKSSVIKRLEA